MHSFHVIIPYKEDRPYLQDKGDYFDYPKDKYKISFVKGTNPSKQRNSVAFLSSSDLLLFLDDDSIPDTNLLKNYNNHFYEYESSIICGGPALSLKTQSTIDHICYYYFQSFLCVGPFYNRYSQSGNCRYSHSLELIGCNLSMKTLSFNAIGGFDEQMYPNEEVDLINRQEEGVFYNPNCFVQKPHRDTVSKFLTQMINYGRGRADNIFKEYYQLRYLILLILLLIFPIFFILTIILSPIHMTAIGISSRNLISMIASLITIPLAQSCYVLSIIFHLFSKKEKKAQLAT